MTNPFDDDNTVFIVLLNDEGQYSLWPEFIDVPPGWKQVGPIGSKEDCSAWIDENWTDMRPKSLIIQMEEDAKKSQTKPES